MGGREDLQARDRIEQRTCRHDGNPRSHGPRTARKPRNRHPWTLSTSWEGATEQWFDCLAWPVWDGLANNDCVMRSNSTSNGTCCHDGNPPSCGPQTVGETLEPSSMDSEQLLGSL